MTTATPEPTEKPKTEEPEATEVVDLGEGKFWCPRCVLMGLGREGVAKHEHGKCGLTTAEVELVIKVFREMEGNA